MYQESNNSSTTEHSETAWKLCT